MANKVKMIDQYNKIKSNYADHLLFFRLGDFYEMFYDDAKLASRELDLTLTVKNCGEEEKAPMCGVPFHSCDTYIARLIEKGYKVAICEQMEDPALAKGLVEREVIKIITPGTVTLGDALDNTKNNYLASVYADGAGAACAFFDISQNAIQAISYYESDTAKQQNFIINEFARFSPSEFITNLDRDDISAVCDFVEKRSGNICNTGMTDIFSEKNRALTEIQFKKSESELGINKNDYLIPRAVGGLIAYLKVTQKTLLGNLNELKIYDNCEYLSIDANSRRNLEICESMRTGEKRGTLLWVLDKTKTCGGARLLRRYLEQPLTNCRDISKRQSAVAELYGSEILRGELRDVLSNIGDIERILARIIYNGTSPKDLLSLSQTFSVLPALSETMKRFSGEELSFLSSMLSDGILPETEELNSVLSRAIVEKDTPSHTRNGGFIKKGFNAELDELNMILTESEKYLENIENTEKELTGIKNMKIGYNRVFGYYFEVSKSQIELVPERYIRKQTLTTGERYITSELKDMETRILGAKDRAVTLENEIFETLCNMIKEKTSILQSACEVISKTDVFASLAEAAVKNSYTCPIVDYSDKLILKDSRHPVVEQFTDGFFVPNDVCLDCEENRMAIITGPNMAGKSTYMRQCALIVIMAQMGSFVPAKEAEIGIVDKVFTRVGASDDLSLGQSTFMLEMSEVANILKNATKKSLIIYDEIGRGTSTFDGMSIAKAVVEYTAGKKCGAKTLFATHYHQLSELENTLDGVKNYNIAAKKRGDSIIFLRKILPGSVDESYGIEVAKLAGVPDEVLRRARENLSELERRNPGTEAPKTRTEETLPIFEGVKDQIIDALKATNIDTLTPIEALGKLYELSKMAKDI